MLCSAITLHRINLLLLLEWTSEYGPDDRHVMRPTQQSEEITHVTIPGIRTRPEQAPYETVVL